MSSADNNLNLPPPDTPMAAATGQQRNLGFENQVSGAFQALQQQLNQGLGQLASGLPQMIREIMHEELQMSQHTAGNKPRMAVHTKQLDDLSGQIDDLTAKCKSLMDLKEVQDRKIDNLSIDLNKKTRENRKLHEIIIQSGQDSAGASDDDIIKDFGDLNYGIMRIVKKHFAASGVKTKWKQYNSLRPDDRDLWLRALIADRMYTQLFHPTARLFGLDEEREKPQIELESKLLERNVPESDVVEWRIQTVKVAGLMSLKKRLYRPHRLADGLFEELEEVRTAADKEAWSLAKDEIEDLCLKGFQLALKLRACTARYEWSQGAGPASLPFSDVELIGPFNAHNKASQLRPVRVLFGTIYKVVDGDRIVLRKGDVLNGNE